MNGLFLNEYLSCSCRRIAQAFVVSLGCLLLAGEFSRGDEPAGKSKTETEIHFGPLARASQLIGASISNDSPDLAGEIEDLLIDLHSGFVPIAIVRTGTAEGRIALPLAAAQRKPGTEKPHWQTNMALVKMKSLQLPDPLSAKAEQVEGWLHAAGLKSPWKQDPHAEQPREFGSLRAHLRQRVQSPGEILMGTVDDLAIDLSRQRVAYSLLKIDKGSATRSGGEIAVPLSAYVRSKSAEVWILELPEQELASRERINDEHLPAELSRSWIEYVSVRYGGDVLSGIQDPRQGSRKELPKSTGE